MTRDEDKAADEFGISVGVMVAFKMSDGITFKVAEPKVAHPAYGTCEPPFWPVLESRYVASRCYSVAEQARISNGRTR